jgi:hypothetical protein
VALTIRFHPAKRSNFDQGRQGLVPDAGVAHRMVGWLLGTRRYFTLTSERPVSTHFGIGHEGRGPDGLLRPLCPECGAITGARGPLVIDQYVDLADTAFGNGNWDPSGGWPLKRPGVNPNLHTYSVEHEDGATAGHGIVTAHVRRASVELAQLLHSGNLAAIRAAGVKIGNETWHAPSTGQRMAAALGAIPVTAEHFPDHHRIAGDLKPFCFQPWLLDPGYAGGGTQRAILIALTPAPPASSSTSNIVAAFDRVRLRSAPRITAGVVLTVNARRRARQEGPILTGGRYLIRGRLGRSWRRIVALDGRRLARPLYTAAPLWRRIG